MMKLLKNIYRDNFCPLGKRLLLELFDDQPTANCGIVLQEVGLPTGKLTLFRWWKSDDVAYFQRSEQDLRTTSESIFAVMKRSASDFDDLLSLVIQADEPRLGHFTGAARDGVAFAVAWGKPKNLRHLSINNPNAGSRHNKLVREIKANAWGETQ